MKIVRYIVAFKLRGGNGRWMTYTFSNRKHAQREYREKLCNLATYSDVRSPWRVELPL